LTPVSSGIQIRSKEGSSGRMCIGVDTHDTLLGNRGMPIEGIVPSETGETATCLLCATQINDIDKASSNHGKQGSSAPKLDKA